jgi:beta-glucosidase
VTATPVEPVGSLLFPANFAWGTATASYQIEGAATEDGRGPSIWDTFSHTPGKVEGGDTGDVADDHYHRYVEDVELMSELGITYYRFSLAWPRLLPDGTGALNAKGAEFYDRLLDELLGRGITPWVTLYHWDLPQPLEDAGGWPVRDTALRFVDYALAAHERFRDRITHWTTLNEPWVASILGYAAGIHAPGRTDPAAAIRTAHHLLLVHGLAVRAMRDVYPEGQYGITYSLSPVQAASDSADDADAARQADGQLNRLFLDPVLRGTYPDDVVADLASVTDMAHVQDGDLETIATPVDFVGVNYYYRTVVRRGSAPTPASVYLGAPIERADRGHPKTEMGWEIDPPGLYDILTRLHRDYEPVPLYITENGAAFADEVAPDGGVHDKVRIDFLDAHLREAHRALTDGVDLRGYFVWSLLDNFEWAHGYSKRFGLVHVDYRTLRRTPKDSFYFYADVIRRGGLPPG